MPIIIKRSNNYAFSDKRCSQQLQAIANPSDEEVALPSSSITIRLLHQIKVKAACIPRVKKIKR